jgi:hypothetical protein
MEKTKISEIVKIQPEDDGPFPTIFDRTPKIVKDKLKEIKNKLPKNIFTQPKGVSLNPNTYSVCYRKKDPLETIKRFWLITGCENVKNEIKKYYNIQYSGNFYSHWNYYEITNKMK